MKKHESNACKIKQEAEGGTESLAFKQTEREIRDDRGIVNRDFPIPGSATRPIHPIRSQQHSQSQTYGRGSTSAAEMELEYNRPLSSSRWEWEGRKRVRSDSTSSSRGGRDVSIERRYRPIPQYPQYPGQYTPSHSLPIPQSQGQGQSHRYTPASTPTIPLPLHTDTTHHPNSMPSMPLTMPMPLISPTQPTQHQRDMSISLAPAYAPTPIAIPISPIPPQRSLYEPPITDTSSEFEIPGKVGENMDDLLSWLFNSNTGTGTGDWAGTQDLGGQQYLPTFLEPTPAPVEGDEVVQGSSDQDQNPSYYHYDPPISSTGENQVRPSNTISTYHSGQQSATTTTAGPTSQHRRYPQPVHPLYVPNIPGKTSIPTFTGTSGRERERYKEVIDEDVKADMMDMFEVSHARLVRVSKASVDLYSSSACANE